VEKLNSAEAEEEMTVSDDAGAASREATLLRLFAEARKKYPKWSTSN
jgi:hypothetical protein